MEAHHAVYVRPKEDNYRGGGTLTFKMFEIGKTDATGVVYIGLCGMDNSVGNVIPMRFDDGRGICNGEARIERVWEEDGWCHMQVKVL